MFKILFESNFVGFVEAPVGVFNYLYWILTETFDKIVYFLYLRQWLNLLSGHHDIRELSCLKGNACYKNFSGWVQMPLGPDTTSQALLHFLLNIEVLWYNCGEQLGRT